MTVLVTETDLACAASVRRSLTPASYCILVDQSPTPIWHCGGDGKFDYFNPAWLRFTGRTLEQATADGWERGIHTEDLARCAEAFRQRWANRQPFELAYRRLRHDGAYRHVVDRAVPLYDDDATFAGFTGHCVELDQDDERIELLAREQKARAEAEAANRLKDEFLATLSHELRTPLSAILGWIQLLRTETLTEAQRVHALETIESSARLQTQLVADILDVSRIITGKLRLDVKWVDLRKVVDAAIETLLPASVAKAIAIDLQVEPLLGPVCGDAERLQQVMWNLLSNAIKFCSRGGQVVVTITPSGDFVDLVVSDNGEGISADALPHIFERFRQADNSTRRRHGGLGLGLAIVRHLVELHGGTIEAQSPGPGLGSTFRVRLHKLAASTLGGTREAAKPEHLPADLAGLHVVVLDDDDALREILSLFLEGNGARVSCVASVAEAIRMVSAERPDAVISDISMPHEDGYDLVRQLREVDRAGQPIPALALTAHARVEERHRTLSAGFHAHLTKPVDMKELVAVVARLCGRR